MPQKKSPEQDHVEPGSSPVEQQGMDAKIANAESAKGTGISESTDAGDHSQIENEMSSSVITDEMIADEKITKAEDAVTPTSTVHIEELRPNTTYEKNGYQFKTDSVGRPKVVSGKLELKPGIRSPEGTRIGKMGIDGDEGGHLIATRFNGPSDAFNIRPQNATLNRGAWKTMENDWAKSIVEGKRVEVSINLFYNDIETIRPSRFDVRYWTDGNIRQKTFLNKAA